MTVSEAVISGGSHQAKKESHSRHKKTGTSAELQHWAPGYPSSGSSDESCAAMWVDGDGECTKTDGLRLSLTKTYDR